MTTRHDLHTKDHYHTLGVPPNATAKDITKAYRKLAREHHPDTNPGNKAAEDRFKDISAAYDILGDETKRREYDAARQAATNPPHTKTGNGTSFFDSYINDLFNDIIRNSRPVDRNNDIAATVTIDFTTAICGGRATVTIYPETLCDTCDGNGTHQNSDTTPCRTCGGTGTTLAQRGFVTTARTCPRCAGIGLDNPTPCPSCRGTGSTPQPKELAVTIPAGADNGIIFKVVGAGHRRRSGTGDLYLTVAVKPDTTFTRQGADIETTVTVSYPCAVRGGTAAVPTVSGDPVHIKIPAGTKPGTRIKLRGKGVQLPDQPGDLIVTVDIDIPNLTPQLEKALDILEKAFETTAEHTGAETGPGETKPRRTLRKKR